jgi:hypothetical protein
MVVMVVMEVMEVMEVILLIINNNNHILLLMLINHQVGAFFFLTANSISISFIAGGYNPNAYGSPPSELFRERKKKILN